MSRPEVRFVADGQERLEEVSRRAIEQEVRARFAKEVAHAGLFDRMRIEDEEVRHWFRTILSLQTEHAQADSAAERAELQRQATLLVAQQNVC